MIQTRIIIDKIWDSHIVIDERGSLSILYIDLHLIHEVTSQQAFSGLRERAEERKRYG